MIKQNQPIALLDTHIWIWLVMNTPQVQSQAFLKMVNELDLAHNLRLSVISIWELGMLHAKGRIDLPYSTLQWVQRAFEKTPGLSMIELTPEIAIESSNLPGDFHADPADRIIIATARSLGATLVTADKPILSYAKKHHIETLSP